MTNKNKYKKIINNLRDIHEKIGLSCDVDTMEFLKSVEDELKKQNNTGNKDA